MDPITLAAIGLGAGGAIGNYFSAPKRYSAEDLNPDSEGLLQQAYRQHRNPTSSLPFYQRLLADRSGFQKDALLSAAAATGGSQAAATKRAEAMGRSARDDALQAAQGTYMQSQGLAMDALRQDMANRRFAIQGATQSEQARRGHRAQFFDQIAGVGFGLLGDKYGAQVGAERTNAAYGPSFRPGQFGQYSPPQGQSSDYRTRARVGLLNY